MVFEIGWWSLKRFLTIFLVCFSFSSASLLAGHANLLAWDYETPEQESGRLWFPQVELDGRTDPVPLVLLAHGNGFRHDEYQFLVDSLVAHGFAVATLNMADGTGIPERVDSIKAHLKHLVASHGSRFREQIGLVGHSRGGEAVVHVANQLVGSPFTIGSVVVMAPSQLEPFTVLSPQASRFFLLLYGSHDSDIYGEVIEDQPLVSPVGLYDGTFTHERSSHHKSMIFIHGGSHAGFSDIDEVDAFDDGGEVAYVPPREQRLLARAFIAQFLRWSLKGDVVAAGLMRHGLLDNQTLRESRSVSRLRYKALYQGDLVVAIDDFEDPFKTRNLTGGMFFVRRGTQVHQDAHFRLDPFSAHRGRGLLISWDVPAGEARKPGAFFEVSAPAHELRRATHLVMNVGQRYLDERNLEDTPQDFHVRLITVRPSKRVRASDWGNLHYPDHNIERVTPYRNFTKSTLSSIQIPLDAFGVRAEEVVQIELLFDVPRRDGKLAGALIFDDVGLARFPGL